VGLGFGNCYERFPGGVAFFCRFLMEANVAGSFLEKEPWTTLAQSDP
jgi:hypothetical protein